MDGIRIWKASLHRSDRETAGFAALLSSVEQNRAERFRHEKDRRRYIVARGLLRTLLGDALGILPERVQIETGLNGKPKLAASNDLPSLCFNTSHCIDTALFAMGDPEMGIDVEAIAPSPDLRIMAAHFFSPLESRALENLSDDDSARSFFRTWVRKEAYLKATGDGFAIDPARVHVPSSSEEGIRLIDDDGDEHIDEKFVVHDLDGVEGCAAALAIPTGTPAVYAIDLLT